MEPEDDLQEAGRLVAEMSERWTASMSMRRNCSVGISRRYKSVTPSRLGPFGIYGSCSDVVFLDDTTMSQGDLEDKSALGGPPRLIVLVSFRLHY